MGTVNSSAAHTKPRGTMMNQTLGYELNVKPEMLAEIKRINADMRAGCVDNGPEIDGHNQVAQWDGASFDSLGLLGAICLESVLDALFIAKVGKGNGHGMIYWDIKEHLMSR